MQGEYPSCRDCVYDPFCLLNGRRGDIECRHFDFIIFHHSRPHFQVENTIFME